MQANESDEILARLGILNAADESPRKMKASKLEVRRTRSARSRVTTDSLSDDSDDEIVFDRNALLNARKRRRRRRSSLRSVDFYITAESRKWKLVCLCLTFLSMGVSTFLVGLTKPDLMRNADSTDLNDYASIFSYGGLGFLAGSVLLSLIFTRLNAFIVISFFLTASIPLSTAIIWQTSLGRVAFLFALQQLLFGAIDRGAYLVVYGVWKGDRRILFCLYTFFALGAALSSLLCTEAVFSRAKGLRTVDSTRVKRALVGLGSVKEAFGNMSMIENDNITEVTRPQSALGIEVEENPKTQENQERRKPVETKTDKNQTADNDNTGKTVTLEVVMLTTTLPITTATTTTRSTIATVPTTTIKQTGSAEGISAMNVPNRSRNRISTSSPGSRLVQIQNTVNNVKDRVEQQINTAPRFAYVLAMVLSIVSVAAHLVGFCTCCLRCQCIADVRIAQLDLDVQQYPEDPLKVKALSFFTWLFQATAESVLLAFLPHFVHFTVEDDTQNRVALFCLAFWLGVASIRLLFLLRPAMTETNKTIKMFYLIGAPSVLLFFSDKSSEATLFCGVSSLGLFITSLPHLTLSWFQSKLQNSAFLVSRRYYAANSLARILGPLMVARTADFAHPTSGISQTVSAAVLLGVVSFVFLDHRVGPLASQRQLKQLTGELTGRPSLTAHYIKKKKGAYEPLVAEESDADVEMDMVVENNLMSDSSESS